MSCFHGPLSSILISCVFFSQRFLGSSPPQFSITPKSKSNQGPTLLIRPRIFPRHPPHTWHPTRSQYQYVSSLLNSLSLSLSLSLNKSFAFRVAQSRSRRPIRETKESLLGL